MLGLTPLGVVHTAFSLVAVGAGVVAFVRDKAIDPANRVGQTYLITTLITVLTGFGIFQHGGFGKPHALGVITLIVLAIAWWARKKAASGGVGAYVETVCYSATFFFHMIPGVTETSTRLPVGAPWVDSPEAPILQKIAGGLFLVFVIGAVLQVRRLRARRQGMSRSAAAASVPAQ